MKLLNSLCSYMLLSHIVPPTRIRNNSKTLSFISNVIITNSVCSVYCISLTTTISDHLPQCLNAPSTKSNISERD